MVELDFKVHKQNIQVFNEVYDESKSQALAEGAKKKAFGLISGIVRMFDKKDDIILTGREKRSEPFWHIKGESMTEYKRSNDYSFPVEPQVRSVKIGEKVFEINPEKPICAITGEDHCIEHYEEEVVTDANAGKELKDKKLVPYLQFASSPIKQTEELMKHGEIVVPAKIRASFLVRDLMKKLIKPVHADKILQEKVIVTTCVLYFRPIYCFMFTEESTKKVKVLEVDALTGEVKVGSIIGKQLKELVHEDTLFDLGTEAVSTFIPGAGLAAIIGKEIHKHSKDKKNLAAM